MREKTDKILLCLICTQSFNIFLFSNYRRHCHYFQEVVELRQGDEISIAEVAYGGEGDRIWREQLHVENRLVEFDTRMGHLCFIVLQSSAA